MNTPNADTPTVVNSASDTPRIIPRAGVEMTRTVDLQFPVEYQGEVFDRITIRRPLMREWRAFLRDTATAAEHGGPEAADMIDQPWLSAPAVVIESLDFVDASRVEVEQESFFAASPLSSATPTDASSD